MTAGLGLIGDTDIVWEADDKARALHLRPYITLGTKAGSTDLENAEKD